MINFYIENHFTCSFVECCGSTLSLCFSKRSFHPMNVCSGSFSMNLYTSIVVPIKGNSELVELLLTFSWKIFVTLFMS